MDGEDRQVIELRLVRIEDMFEMPQIDLFSEFRNFLTGVDFCISTLRSRRDRRPVRLDITLPPTAIEAGLEERLRRTLQRYCNHRIRYNRREGRAVRLDGVSALRVGLPIALFGLLLMAWGVRIEEETSTTKLIVDHMGWVFAWIGLWFPLDEIFFYGLNYGRESRILTLLRDAEIVIGPYRSSSVDAPA